MDRIFNALGDPARVAIVEELVARNDQTLFEIVSKLVSLRQLSMSRQAFAKHLAVLREAGLVTVEIVGRTSVHHLEHPRLREAADWLIHVTDEGKQS